MYHIPICKTRNKILIGKSIPYSHKLVGLFIFRYFEHSKTEYATEAQTSQEPQPLPPALAVAAQVPQQIQIPRNKPPTEQPRQPFRQQPPPMKVWGKTIVLMLVLK